MKPDEVKALLVLIESYDRSPFRPEAVDVWHEELRNVMAVDADAAVRKHYRVNARDDRGNIRRVLPAEVVRVAEDIGDARRRRAIREARQDAIEAPPKRVGSTGRPRKVEAALAASRARVEAAVSRYRERTAA